MDYSQIIANIIISIIGLILLFFANLARKYITTETKKKYARLAVLFAQQVYHDLDGSKKFIVASEKLSEVLESYGIKIGASELEMLIEGTLKEVKAELSDVWDK